MGQVCLAAVGLGNFGPGMRRLCADLAAQACLHHVETGVECGAGPATLQGPFPTQNPAELQDPTSPSQAGAAWDQSLPYQDLTVVLWARLRGPARHGLGQDVALLSLLHSLEWKMGLLGLPS